MIVSVVGFVVVLPTKNLFRLYSSMNKFIQESFTVSLSSKSPLEKDQNALPVHFLPSPEYPALHAHAYDPTVLLHTALTPQLWALEEHSSISGKM